MKIRSLLLALAATLMATGSASAQAQMKIGIVDMKRVFQEYHKTKDAEKKVNEDKSKAKKDLDQRSAAQRQQPDLDPDRGIVHAPVEEP